VRTQEELAAFVSDSRINHDPFGFGIEVILPYLEAENAKVFTIATVDTARIWKEQGYPRKQDREAMLKEAQQYMEFAWGKAMNHRGLSAERSVSKMAAWMFLLGEDALLNTCFDDSKYPKYGAPILKDICVKLGWEIPADVAILRMIKGLPCQEECEQGCNG